MLSLVLCVSLLPLQQASAMNAVWQKGAENAYPVMLLFVDALKTFAKEKNKDKGVKAGSVVIKTEQNKDVKGNLYGTVTNLTNRTFTIEENGKKGKARVIDNRTGGFLYQPFADNTGTDSFTFRVEDQFGTYDIGTVTVIIDMPNQAPVADKLSFSTGKGTAVSGMLKGLDPDGNSITYHIDVSPTKGTVTITDPKKGAFTYTPHPGQTGTDTFKFSVHDGKVSSNWGTVTIEITE